MGVDAFDSREDDRFPAGSDYSAIGINRGQQGVYDLTATQYNSDLSASYGYGITEGLTATSILGAQLFAATSKNFYLQKQNYSTGLVTNVGAGADLVQADEGQGEGREAGIFVQQEFAYDNTYFFSAGVRNDTPAA